MNTQTRIPASAPIDPKDIPPSVIEAARQVEAFFSNRGALVWTLGGIQSRVGAPCGSSVWGVGLTAMQVAEQVADVPDVHEALQTFSHDATAENANWLVCAVMTATRGAAPAAAPARPFAIVEDALLAARALVDRVNASDLVLTVEQVPLWPPAMGHHETVLNVRQARARAS